ELPSGEKLGKVAKLRYERSPLTALRSVTAGSTYAVLLDPSQVEGLSQLPFAGDLKNVGKLQPIPRPIVAASRKLDKALAAKLQKGVLSVANEPDAKQSLTQFNVDGVVPPDMALIDSVRKRFAKK